MARSTPGVPTTTSATAWPSDPGTSRSCSRPTGPDHRPPPGGPTALATAPPTAQTPRAVARSRGGGLPRLDHGSYGRAAPRSLRDNQRLLSPAASAPANRNEFPMSTSRKVIITCAVTGAIHTPSMSKYLPVTASEIAEAAIGAAEAGAAIVHLHARDPHDGRPSQNPDHFVPILDELKAHTT